MMNIRKKIPVLTITWQEHSGFVLYWCCYEEPMYLPPSCICHSWLKAMQLLPLNFSSSPLRTLTMNLPVHLSSYKVELSFLSSPIVPFSYLVCFILLSKQKDLPAVHYHIHLSFCISYWLSCTQLLPNFFLSLLMQFYFIFNFLSHHVSCI